MSQPWELQVGAYLADARVQCAARFVFEAESFERRELTTLAMLSRRASERAFAVAEALHEAGVTAW